MIYKLAENYFDLNKLENISQIFECRSCKLTEYWFNYNINGHFNEYWDKDKNIVTEEREKLIKEWQKNVENQQ